MKRIILIIAILCITEFFAQENPEKAKLQKEFTELQKQSNELKAQIYDAQEFLEVAKKQLEEFKKKMIELNQKYQAILDSEKKGEKGSKGK